MTWISCSISPIVLYNISKITIITKIFLFYEFSNSSSTSSRPIYTNIEQNPINRFYSTHVHRWIDRETEGNNTEFVFIYKNLAC